MPPCRLDSNPRREGHLVAAAALSKLQSNPSSQLAALRDAALTPKGVLEELEDSDFTFGLAVLVGVYSELSLAGWYGAVGRGASLILLGRKKPTPSLSNGIGKHRSMPACAGGDTRTGHADRLSPPRTR